jgi:hypothetical protein
MDLNDECPWCDAGTAPVAPAVVGKTPETADLVAFIKQYATENYERDGWDVVVETYEDQQIADELGWCTTEAGAIRKMRAAVRPYASRRADIEALAF